MDSGGQFTNPIKIVAAGVEGDGVAAARRHHGCSLCSIAHPPV
jgi:hypothetical protein